MRKTVEFRVLPHRYSKSQDCDPSLVVEGAKGRGMIQSDWLIIRSLTKFQKMESILDK